MASALVITSASALLRLLNVGMVILVVTGGHETSSDSCWNPDG